jgi:L-ascorbate metabolism protein UlaG (beta-lactamase superfamily)
MFEYNNIKIIWTGHDGFKIKNRITIYIDPYGLSKPEPADLVLITHEHFDHLSKGDLEKIVTSKTVLVGPYEIKNIVETLPGVKVYVKPGDIIEEVGVKIWAVPAYNINKFRSPGVVFHPREELKVGFVIEVDGVKIYHAGDTDNIPELKGIECDIALLPVSGTYVMTADEAVDAAKTINPKVAIPMHYGAIVGSKDDAFRFRDKLSATDIKVIILEKE